MNEQNNETSRWKEKVIDLFMRDLGPEAAAISGKVSSPLRLLAILTLTVFVVELAIMVGIEFFINSKSSLLFRVVEAVFDATTLTLIVFPVLYRYSFRPLVSYVFAHQQVDQALQSSNALLENTFASLSDVVLVVRMPDQLTITCNRATQSVLGYSCADLRGQSMAVLFNDSTSYQLFVQRLSAAFQAGRFCRDEMEIRRKDGRSIPAEITVTEIKNDAGQTSSQVIVIRDISQRKQAQAQLERHNQELTMLGHLGQTVVSSLELDVIFNHVINRVMPLLHAECFSILLRQNDHLVYAANGGPDIKAQVNQTIPVANSILGQVVLTGEPILLTAPSQPADSIAIEIKQLCYCEPTELMAVPLRVENEIIGVMQASHTQRNTFNADGLRILQSVANWAAIAISHARQHEELQRRFQETNTLSAINQSLNQTLESDKILQLIADTTPDLIPQVDRVVIHLMKEGDTLLYPAIWSGESGHDAPTLYLNSYEGVAGRALKTGNLINVPDVANDPDFLPFTTSNPFKSLMVAPLQSGRNQLGAISVHNIHVKNAFSIDNEQLLTRLADSASVAIAAANLYQAERNQRQFAESLAQAAAALSVSLRLNEIIQIILDQTVRLVGPCEKAAILLVKDGQIYLTRSTDDRKLPQRLPDALHRIFVQRDASTLPPAELIAETGKPILLTEIEDDLSFPNEETVDWLTSTVVAPLRIRNQIIGFLTVHSAKPGAFEQEAIRQIEALAAHASLAIHNATLFNELKAALQKEQSTRAQLVQAQKLSAMGRMVASVAHELNNPLQTIKNCLFLTQQDVVEMAEANTYIDMALSETQRLSNLVLQLREVYRPGGIDPMQEISLNALVNEVQLLLQQHLKQNNIVWKQELGTQEQLVMGDANQLKQVLLNICLNGVEAMQPDGGALTIQLYRDLETAEISLALKDTGPGIPSDNLSHLFEPFFTTKDSGTGLGLAICYDIIQSHGGRIDVKSVVGQGSAFIIRLPSEASDVSFVEEASS